jgi:hypothetical protein
LRVDERAALEVGRSEVLEYGTRAVQPLFSGNELLIRARIERLRSVARASHELVPLAFIQFRKRLDPGALMRPIQNDAVVVKNYSGRHVCPSVRNVCAVGRRSIILVKVNVLLHSMLEEAKGTRVRALFADPLLARTVCYAILPDDINNWLSKPLLQVLRRFRRPLLHGVE